MNEAPQQFLALLYLVTPLVLVSLIIARLIDRPRRRVRSCVLALVAWVVHICSMVVVIAPGLSGHWHPTPREERVVDIVVFGGLIIVLALVVAAFIDRAQLPPKNS